MSTVKPIRYRVIYLGSCWAIEIENSAINSGKWVMVHKQQQTQRVDKFGSIEFIYEILKFNSQKEAYKWISDNLDSSKSEEYIEKSSFFGTIKKYFDNTVFGSLTNHDDKIS